MSVRDELIPDSSFEVRFDGVVFGFSRISSISASAEYDTIVEGGTNGAPVLLPKPKRAADTIVFAKGLKTNTSDMMFSLFSEGNVIKNILVIVRRQGKMARIFTVSNAMITRREFAPLDAMGSQVFLEAIQLAHTGITELAVPF
jgi:phage tail-like protein